MRPHGPSDRARPGARGDRHVAGSRLSRLARRPSFARAPTARCLTRCRSSTSLRAPRTTQSKSRSCWPSAGQPRRCDPRPAAHRARRARRPTRVASRPRLRADRRPDRTTDRDAPSSPIAGCEASATSLLLTSRPWPHQRRLLESSMHMVCLALLGYPGHSAHSAIPSAARPRAATSAPRPQRRAL